MHNQYGGVNEIMSEVILEKPDTDKGRTSLIGHSNTNQTNAHWPFASSLPEDYSNARLIEDKKAAVLERLECANEKLKIAHRVISEAVLLALEMKHAGGDFAGQMPVVMAAQDDIRNAAITVNQAQAKITNEELRKRDLNITKDVVFAKDTHFKDRHREAKKPLYLARYE
jgi:hypothetical protein